jgi:hypothetical protein
MNRNGGVGRSGAGSALHVKEWGDCSGDPTGPSVLARQTIAPCLGPCKPAPFPLFPPQPTTPRPSSSTKSTKSASQATARWGRERGRAATAGCPGGGGRRGGPSWRRRRRRQDSSSHRIHSAAVSPLSAARCHRSPLPPPELQPRVLPRLEARQPVGQEHQAAAHAGGSLGGAWQDPVGPRSRTWPAGPVLTASAASLQPPPRPSPVGGPPPQLQGEARRRLEGRQRGEPPHQDHLHERLLQGAGRRVSGGVWGGGWGLGEGAGGDQDHLHGRLLQGAGRRVSRVGGGGVGGGGARAGAVGGARPTRRCAASVCVCGGERG